MKNKITAIVLAAGQGTRMNSPVAKQFLTLQDKPVLYYSLKAFEESNVDDIILVTGSGQEEYCREEIVEHFHIKKVSKIIEGGKERYDSVHKALMNTETSDYILIHDGARPFISAQLINDLILQVINLKACILGVPVKDTVKIVGPDGTITATPNRNSLWSAQTPQAFEYALIKRAYDMFYEEPGKEGLGVTDDAMVYETYIKHPVKVLMGSYNNLKLTTQEDLFYAEKILEGLLCEKDKKKEQFFHE